FRSGHAERLGGGIDVEPGPAAVFAGANHGEADAVACDRGAVGNRGAIIAAGDAQAMQLPLRGRREADDFANVGTDTRKHQARSKIVRVSLSSVSLARTR